MSSLYNQVRQEIAAGGDPGGPSPKGGASGWITLAVLVGLVAWVAASNPWMLVFIAGLLVCVFLHELGHFVTARLTGMKVTQFFMGFGPRLWSRQRGELEYGLRALPLGAFVRIVGMNNLDDCPPEDEPRAYRSKSYPRRMLVITAGSLMHLVAAFLLFAGTYAVSGRFGETGDVTVVEVIDEVLGETTGAKLAGLRPGDVLVSVDGVRMRSEDDVFDLMRTRSPGEVATIVVRRDGAEFSRDVEFVDAGGDRAFLGIGPSSVDWVDLGPAGAIRWAATDIVDYAVESIRGVFVVLDPRNLVSNVVSEEADPMTRPTTIVGATQVGGFVGREDGLRSVLLLLAGVNVFFGIFNLFPCLPFDGGHAAIATYERIRSRKGRPYRADVGKMMGAATVVMVLMLAVFAVGLYLDLTQPFG